MIVNPRTEIISTSGSPFQKKCIPMGADKVVSPSSSQIIGEGAPIFTNMTDTMLTVLDWWMALTAQAWELENSLAENALATGQLRSQLTSYVKDLYPDLYLPVQGNFKISEVFYGYSDSLSLYNNLMVLVELKDLAHWYGTPIYAVDRVNRKMYSTFEGGYKLISERATLEPQFRITASLGSESTDVQPVYVNTLPGMTSIGIPIAKSTLVSQTGPRPSMPIPTPRVWDILEPSLNEQVRAAYLERQMQNMGSMQIPSSMPPIEDDITLEDESLSRRIQDYCLRIKDHRRCEKGIHQVTLSSIKECKEKQQQQKS